LDLLQAQLQLIEKFKSMRTQAPNLTAVTGGIKTGDPRIISPDIKVIYPSESIQKDLEISEQQTTAPLAQVLPTAPLSTIETPKESTIIIKETPPPTTTEPAKVPTWKDTIKENAVLFIAVALISVGIGVLIGKKM
jgi:hypothetical protein